MLVIETGEKQRRYHKHPNSRQFSETLDRKITQGALNAPPENLAITKRYIKQFRDDLNAASEALRIELEKGNVSEKYWSKVLTYKK